MLAAALYLVSVIGPHAVTLNQQVREADRQWGRSGAGEFAKPSRAPVAEITRLLDRYLRDSEPLPMLPGHWVGERLAAGWQPDDPLLPVGLNTLARQAGITQFSRQWLDELRDPLEEAVAAVGVQEIFARDGTLIDRADGQGRVPWSPPLHQLAGRRAGRRRQDRGGGRDRRGLGNARQRTDGTPGPAASSRPRNSGPA